MTQGSSLFFFFFFSFSSSFSGSPPPPFQLIPTRSLSSQIYMWTEPEQGKGDHDFWKRPYGCALTYALVTSNTFHTISIKTLNPKNLHFFIHNSTSPMDQIAFSNKNPSFKNQKPIFLEMEYLTVAFFLVTVLRFSAEIYKFQQYRVTMLTY